MNQASQGYEKITHGQDEHHDVIELQALHSDPSLYTDESSHLDDTRTLVPSSVALGTDPKSDDHRRCWNQKKPFHMSIGYAWAIVVQGVTAVATKIDNLLNSPLLAPRRSWPIVALVVQTIMLVGTIAFIIWSSIAHRPVPHAVASFYLRYPQYILTVRTQIATMLSLVNTKLLAEAIKFATNVWLGHVESRGMSLHSVFLLRMVVSKTPAVNMDGNKYLGCSSLAFIFILAFQTPAWISLLTPRPILTSHPSSFYDIDIVTSFLMNGLSDTIGSPWTEAATAGMMAARQDLNMTQSYSFMGHAFIGTTRGILPISIPQQANDWTSAVALQQGFTANVTCEVIPDSDPAISSSNTTIQVFNNMYSEYSICCNCTGKSGDQFSGRGPPILYQLSYNKYVAFAVCPYWGATSSTPDTITVYVQGSAPWIANRTCSIKPELLTVNVTYNNGGFVTINQTEHLPMNLPVNSSTIVFNAVMTMLSQFDDAQAPNHNTIEDILLQISNEYKTQINQDELVNLVLAGYIRGLFEHSATVYRVAKVTSALTSLSPQDEYTTFSLPQVENKTYMQNNQVLVWGHDPTINKIQIHQLKYVIIFSPLSIMIATITIILFAFYKARGQDLEYLMYFDPTDTLHVIAACSSGNLDVAECNLPGYREHARNFTRVRFRLAKERK